MPFCSKCSTEVTKVHQCEHTDDKEYCVECYTELHYYITEKNKIDRNWIIYWMGYLTSFR